jgi:site-specific recombinase XerD
MQRTTFSVLFYIRRTKLTREGEAPILLRLTVNGVRTDIYVKKTVPPVLWNTAKGKANEKNLRRKELNLYLGAVKMRLMKLQREMELDGLRVTAQSLIDRYLGKDQPKRYTLMEVFREHNEKCRKLAGIDMAPATVLRYETSLKHTLEFMRHTYRRDDIYLDELNRQFIEDYEFYLKTERKCCHNTATKYLKNFRKIILIALEKEWLKRDPFSGVKFTLDDVERDFLESHEIEKVWRKQIDIERLEVVRDIFVFCSLSGLAFSDVKQLRTEHIATDAHGNKWIRKARQKTGNMCNIPLMEIPLQIIEKYRSHPYCVAHGVLLPVSSNQKYNSYLKELADISGIKKQISSHTARHTFGTYALAHGVSMESVAKMLGHSDTKMTRHYARVLDSTVLREMSGIRGGLGGNLIANGSQTSVAL